MDEVWRNIPGRREPSVHLTLFPSELAIWGDDVLLRRWEELRSLRDAVNAELENARQAKTINANLSARIDLDVEDPALNALVKVYEDFLPTLFGVSEVAVKSVGTPGAFAARVRKADGVKCERCWRFVPAITAEGICDRCVDALAEPVNG
jgi:isoleucyl-tRNA synthetase